MSAYEPVRTENVYAKNDDTLRMYRGRNCVVLSTRRWEIDADNIDAFVGELRRMLSDGSGEVEVAATQPIEMVSHVLRYANDWMDSLEIRDEIERLFGKTYPLARIHDVTHELLERGEIVKRPFHNATQCRWKEVQP